MTFAPTLRLAVLAFTAGLTLPPAFAQATDAAGTIPVPAARLTEDFSQWAGSPENASALVSGLRAGKPITLVAPAPARKPGNATFSPPTKPMGYANIRIALTLAQQQLARQGITQPTPQQLQATLVGSPPEPQGVLQMRASGMSWGKIATTLGQKPGSAASSKPAPAPETASGKVAPGAGASTKSSSGKKGNRKSAAPQVPPP